VLINEHDIQVNEHDIQVNEHDIQGLLPITLNRSAKRNTIPKDRVLSPNEVWSDKAGKTSQSGISVWPLPQEQVSPYRIKQTLTAQERLQD
jgi:hypothetical protein